MRTSTGSRTQQRPRLPHLTSLNESRPIVVGLPIPTTRASFPGNVCGSDLSTKSESSGRAAGLPALLLVEAAARFGPPVVAPKKLAMLAPCLDGLGPEPRDLPAFFGGIASNQTGAVSFEMRAAVDA